MFVSLQAAVGQSQAMFWPAIVYVNPRAHLFTLEDWVSCVNISVRQFVKVILPVHFQQNPSFVANVMNSYLTLGKVNLTIAPDVMTCYLTPDGVNWIIAPDAMTCYLTRDGLNWTIAPDATSYRTFDGLNSATAEWYTNSLPSHLRGVLPMVISVPCVKSCILIQRDQTVVYDAAEYPFFMLHSRQSDLLGFGETFKIYAYHLSQYQLVYVIEFVFHWSNNICYFVSQNIWILINFDLTPQQHCQRAYLTMCQSLYYRHDFAIISTVHGLSTNYVVACFVKYYENILCLIFKLKDHYKIQAVSSTKRGSKIQISNFVEPIEHKKPNKIGGGKHGASIEKIGMEVISPFVISMPVNDSDIKICEFVEHLEMSKGLKNYSSSNHVFCNVPLHLLAACLFQNSRISIGHKHGIHILKTMTKPEIIESFRIHDNACGHKYVTVFHPYKKIPSSERGTS